MEYLAKEKRIDLSLIVDDKLLPFVKNMLGDEGRYT